jgi:riboflavin kinase/FMN adenylyltransferase
VPISRDTFLAVGVFDGVHRGHQSLIARLKAEAAKRGLSAGVFTFRNHPLTVLQPNVKLGYITSPETRQELLCSEGLDTVTMIEFTPEVSRITAREFVSTLQERLGMKGLVVGPDFALGRNREGNVETLRKLGDEMGFEVVELAAKTEDDETIISSSAVRAAIMKGDIERANGLLGRPFTLEGEVMEGDRRGATLGFPTANLKPDPERIVPGNGIYATWTLVEGAGHPSATSIGVRPTFDAGDRTIETHVIDFNGDLYGKQIALQFVKRLRDEIRFANVEELKTQMTKDLEQARRALSSRRQEVA